MREETRPLRLVDPWHPFVLAAGAVSVATRLLPAGAVRDRYQREFLAELHGMSDRDQVRHSIQLLLTAGLLRAAVVNAERSSTLDALPVPRAPRVSLACRLHLYHRWRTQYTEDGHRYKSCAKCGKDMPGAGPLDYLGGAGGG
jgi:hypothetical protein